MEKSDETHDTATGTIQSKRSGLGSFLGSSTMHMVIEVLVVCILLAYFSRKHSALSKSMEALAQRLEEQQTVIDKQAKVIAEHDKLLRRIMSGTAPPPQRMARVPEPANAPEPAKTSECTGNVCPIPQMPVVPTAEDLDRELSEEYAQLNGQ